MLPGVPTTTPSCMLMDNWLNNTFRWSQVCSVLGGALQPPQRFSEQSWTWEPRGGPWDGFQTHVFFLRVPQIILISSQVGEPPGWEHLKESHGHDQMRWVSKPKTEQESQVSEMKVMCLVMKRSDGGPEIQLLNQTHRTICSDGPAMDMWHL